MKTLCRKKEKKKKSSWETPKGERMELHLEQKSIDKTL